MFHCLSVTDIDDLPLAQGAAASHDATMAAACCFNPARRYIR